MHVYFTPRARAALFRIASRWKEKAYSPDVFNNDISAIVERLASSPTTGVIAKRTTKRIVYRMGTAKTMLHVYYVVDAAKSQVTVLQVWSQRRAGPPKL